MTVLMLHTQKNVIDKLKHYYGFKITIILASHIYNIEQLALVPVVVLTLMTWIYDSMEPNTPMWKEQCWNWTWVCTTHLNLKWCFVSVEFKRRPGSSESDRPESETTLRSRTSTKPSALTRSTPTPGSALWAHLWTAAWIWAITLVQSVRRAPETRPCP